MSQERIAELERLLKEAQDYAAMSNYKQFWLNRANDHRSELARLRNEGGGEECQCCGGSGYERYLGRDNSEEVIDCPLCKTASPSPSAGAQAEPVAWQEALSDLLAIVPRGREGREFMARRLWNNDQPGCSWTESNCDHYVKLVDEIVERAEMACDHLAPSAPPLREATDEQIKAFTIARHASGGQDGLEAEKTSERQRREEAEAVLSRYTGTDMPGSGAASDYFAKYEGSNG